MKSYAYPGNLIGSLRRRRLAIKSCPAALGEVWVMLKLVGWAATMTVLAFLMWQATAAEPFWPPAVSALLLVVASVLAGLRIGADSAAAYTKDLQRVNKVLADQNRELADANAMLLKQLSSESHTPSKSF